MLRQVTMKSEEKTKGLLSFKHGLSTLLTLRPSRSAHGEAMTGAVILAALAGAVSAVGAVATAEQFPGEGRITGLALGATTATAIFGGLTPYAAQLLVERTGWPTAPGIMIALVALLVLPVMLMMHETAPLRATNTP